MAAACPDAARVEGETTVTLQTPSGSVVAVETRSWVTQQGMTIAGRILMDGQLFFERQWQR